MKNKTLGLILFTLMYSFIAYTQDSLNISDFTGSDTLVDKGNKKPFIIKYSPCSIFGDYVTTSWGVQLGVETNLSKQFSFQQDIQYIFINRIDHGIISISVKNIKGIRTDTEIKYYFKRHNLNGHYFAPHLLYQFTRAINDDYYNNEYYIDRNMIGLHGKIGWQYISKKGFVFDSAFGIGTRYISSRSNKNIIFDSNSYENWTLFFSNKIYRYGDKLLFSVTGSFKIGWCF